MDHIPLSKCDGIWTFVYPPYIHNMRRRPRFCTGWSDPDNSARSLATIAIQHRSVDPSIVVCWLSSYRPDRAAGETKAYTWQCEIGSVPSTRWPPAATRRRIRNQRSIKKMESYLPACNVFGGMWRSFSGAAYWMMCNSCLRVASPMSKPASTQSQWRVGIEPASRQWHNARTAPRRPRLDTSQSYFYDCQLHTS